MRSVSFVVLVLVSGCAVASPPLPVPPPAPEVETGAPAVVLPPPVIAVTRAYHAAVGRELPAVLASDVSAETVTRIHAADREARAALSRLEAQGRHYTPDALATARAAVRRLTAVLEDPSS